MNVVSQVEISGQKFLIQLGSLYFNTLRILLKHVVSENEKDERISLIIVSTDFSVGEIVVRRWDNPFFK
jgi:hypothetical protein